ncbi:hypothetical protein BD779DRAFT_1479057 [Infundibulicybe gibba]|nr:hypothetical protein BD779DRAFT_1479057 [Infundibulicybe gibba]
MPYIRGYGGYEEMGNWQIVGSGMIKTKAMRLIEEGGEMSGLWTELVELVDEGVIMGMVGKRWQMFYSPYHDLLEDNHVNIPLPNMEGIPFSRSEPPQDTEIDERGLTMILPVPPFFLSLPLPFNTTATPNNIEPISTRAYLLLSPSTCLSPKGLVPSTRDVWSSLNNELGDREAKTDLLLYAFKEENIYAEALEALHGCGEETSGEILKPRAVAKTMINMFPRASLTLDRHNPP